MPGTHGPKNVRPTCFSPCPDFVDHFGKACCPIEDVVFAGVHAGGAAHARESERVERIDRFVVLLHVVEAHLFRPIEDWVVKVAIVEVIPLKPLAVRRVPAIRRGALPEKASVVSIGVRRGASGEGVAVLAFRYRTGRGLMEASFDLRHHREAQRSVPS